VRWKYWQVLAWWEARGLWMVLPIDRRRFTVVGVVGAAERSEVTE
jgi:hypothetical protein